MNRVVVYASFSISSRLKKALSDREVIYTQTIREFIEKLVEERTVICGVYQPDQSPEDAARFIRSLTVSYPLLYLFVVSSDLEPGLGRRVRLFGSSGSIDSLSASIAESLKRIDTEERRQYNRFSWPLKGALELAEGVWADFNIFSISAGGGFLEHTGEHPQAGNSYPMQIRFQNCVLETACRVMDPRHSSSNMPDGFGFQFIGLSKESEDALSNIINDALINTIIESERNRELPSLDEELLTPQFELM